MAKIPTGLSSFSSKSSKNQSTPTIFPVRVKYIFFNDKDYPTQWDDYGQYASIGSILFEEINNSRDASVELEYVEAELNAQIEAKKITTDVNKLTSVCRVLMGNGIDNMTIPELKRDILLYAKARPEDFMDTINDPMLELMDTIHQFMMAGFITFRNNNKDVYYNLPNNKKKMLTVPYGEDPNYIVGSFLQSDEGLEVFKLLKNKLSNKK